MGIVYEDVWAAALVLTNSACRPPRIHVCTYTKFSRGVIFVVGYSTSKYVENAQIALLKNFASYDTSE